MNVRRVLSIGPSQSLAPRAILTQSGAEITLSGRALALVTAAFTLAVHLKVAPLLYGEVGLGDPITMHRLTQLGLAAALLCLPAAALAAPADAQASGKANIRRPILLEKVDDLDFGTFAASAVSGTVIIDPATGAQSTLGGVTAVASAVSHRARFRARGPILGGAIVLLGPPPILSNGSGGVMPVAALTMDGGVIRTFDPSGNLEIGVGGVLEVGSGQAEGDYSGTFTLTVIYL